MQRFGGCDRKARRRPQAARRRAGLGRRRHVRMTAAAQMRRSAAPFCPSVRDRVDLLLSPRRRSRQSPVRRRPTRWARTCPRTEGGPISDGHSEPRSFWDRADPLQPNGSPHRRLHAVKARETELPTVGGEVVEGREQRGPPAEVSTDRGFQAANELRKACTCRSTNESGPIVETLDRSVR